MPRKKSEEPTNETDGKEEESKNENEDEDQRNEQEVTNNTQKKGFFGRFFSKKNKIEVDNANEDNNQAPPIIPEINDLKKNGKNISNIDTHIADQEGQISGCVIS